MTGRRVGLVLVRRWVLEQHARDAVIANLSPYWFSSGRIKAAREVGTLSSATNNGKEGPHAPPRTPTSWLLYPFHSNQKDQLGSRSRASAPAPNAGQEPTPRPTVIFLRSAQIHLVEPELAFQPHSSCFPKFQPIAPVDSSPVHVAGAHDVKGQVLWLNRIRLTTSWSETWSSSIMHSVSHVVLRNSRHDRVVSNRDRHLARYVRIQQLIAVLKSTRHQPVHHRKKS